MIRVKPSVGQHIVLNKGWFENNLYIYAFMQDLQPAKVYEIVSMSSLDDRWGITSIKDVETQEVFDVFDHEELSDYFCMIDAEDNVRLL